MFGNLESYYRYAQNVHASLLLLFQHTEFYNKCIRHTTAARVHLLLFESTRAIGIRATCSCHRVDPTSAADEQHELVGLQSPTWASFLRIHQQSQVRSGPQSSDDAIQEKGDGAGLWGLHWPETQRAAKSSGMHRPILKCRIIITGVPKFVMGFHQYQHTKQAAKSHTQL